tara:strand:- start:95 stop:721 length:627 start_codon:yes stop_codon:yes gene_type:complete
MDNLFRLIFIITFFIVGCSPNEIEENKVTKEINSLNLNIFSKNGNKKYSIKSPYSTYNNVIDKFEFQKATINIFQKGKLKYYISSDEATLSNNNKILKLSGNVILKTNNKEEDYLYADSFIWNIDETNYLLNGNIRFENNNVILTSGQAKMGSDNIIEFFKPVKYIIKNDNYNNKYEINSENATYNLENESLSFMAKDRERVRSIIYF